ncbi:tRNA wybutosine-synthesizing protein 2 homolog isoform X2 [Halyomorpha halys]|uniref:tRNA wybutosine-synthesizing protein 2 homolog isoform X2 n=1 Tax=Halyomorpha halys TaxID=286706 RepID=UPI000D0C73BD|nr:tRNA wybutosine-synthesizing protein 2 homolog isoform X2 [Halyomorpha halys]
MTKLNSVKSKLHDEITNYMKNDNKWYEYLVNELPSSWENYNGFLVFSFPSFMSHIWLEAGPGIWQVICKSLKAHSIAIKGRIQNDSFRTPQACLVYGSSPVIMYLDNKIRYSWNVEKTMFSAGNVTERHRIATLKCDNEVIVDLFAGIGYFTLPFLVHANAKLVHACEWNPDAVDSLRRNLRLNKVEDKCIIKEGDNRKIFLVQK